MVPPWVSNLLTSSALLAGHAVQGYGHQGSGLHVDGQVLPFGELQGASSLRVARDGEDGVRHGLSVTPGAASL